MRMNLDAVFRGSVTSKFEGMDHASSSIIAKVTGKILPLHIC